MLLDLPSSVAGLLSLFGSCFTAPTFETFCGLAVGALTRVRSRTVTGMLAACGMSDRWHHARAHRFFSRAAWSVDAVGLVMLDLIIARLLGPGERIVVAVDDTLLRRFGPRVFARALHYDPSAGGRQVAYGNNWVVCGVIVKLAFLDRVLCLPVLFRLHRPKHGPPPAALARELIGLIAERHGDRELVVLGDGGYSGGLLAPSALPANVTLILRANRRARLHHPAPLRVPGQPGRPRLKGDQLPSLAQLAATGEHWQQATVTRYRTTQTIELITQQGLWWRQWRHTPARTIAIRDRNSPEQIHSVLITNNLTLPTHEILETYAQRWAIEVTFRDAKGLAGVGDPENRTPQAVTRTTPFMFLCLTLAITWYALHGHDPTDLTTRRQRARWYRTKHQPSTDDMLIKLRRTIIANRISNDHPNHPHHPKPSDIQHLCDLIAA